MYKRQAGRSTDCGKYLGICYGAVSFDNIVKEDIFMFEAFYEKYAPASICIKY